jgi:hypothetical protein
MGVALGGKSRQEANAMGVDLSKYSKEDAISVLKEASFADSERVKRILDHAIALAPKVDQQMAQKIKDMLGSVAITNGWMGCC